MEHKNKKIMSVLVVLSAGLVTGITHAQDNQHSGGSAPLQAAQKVGEAQTTNQVRDQTTDQAVGSSTRRLLELQRSGSRTSDHQQYVSASEMQRIYQRHLESFEHRIPEYFIKPEFTAE